MSHVDEGTLHAYLDGELSAVERERVDAHLKGCAACQARLAEERAIIERAGRLLGMATPPERAVPPLDQLRQPRLSWRLRRPLAWAATLILAVGLGWYARGAMVEREMRGDAETGTTVAAAPRSTSSAGYLDSESDALRPRARLSMRLQTETNSVAKDRDGRQLAAARATGAASNAVQNRESAAVATGALALAKTDAARLPAAPPPSPSVRGDRAATQAAEPQPHAAAAAVAELSHAQPGVVTIDGAPAPGRRAPAIMSTTWPIIARQPARDVLGVEPVVIPGFAVRAYRRNPAAREIVVEQVTDAGTTISLIERRLDGSKQELSGDSAADNSPRAMAKAVNERLARFVGPLRIEIDGPLTPDSLSSLLELAR